MKTKTIKILSFLLLMTPGVWADRSEAPSNRNHELIISEIMYNPKVAVGQDGDLYEFIEIYNSSLIELDLSGFEISGDVDFILPAGTKIGAQSYLVVARDSATYNSHYGKSLSSSLSWGLDGGNLPNSGGAVRIKNKRGSVLFTVSYNDTYPWPKAADGLGHSLVLDKPDLGESHPGAWRASTNLKGSPGAKDAIATDAASQVVINEILVNPNTGDAEIELYNTGSSSADLTGYKLLNNTHNDAIPTSFSLSGSVSGKSVKKFTIPASGSFVLPPKGSFVYFTTSSGRVIDNVEYRALKLNESFGRWPDGADAWGSLSSATLGNPNATFRQEDIVITEIMYDPISGDKNDEFIELYNRGSQTVDISGWKIRGAVSHTIRANVQLDAGDYFVIARDDKQMLANYTYLDQAEVDGDYDGSLDNTRGIVRLLEPISLSTGTENRLVDEVYYHDHWGKYTDGGGSSLELIDPDADNALASNWKGSDESIQHSTGQQRSNWTTISYLESDMQNGKDPGSGNYAVQLMLLDEGECLVDNVVVKIGGSTRSPANGTFESLNDIQVTSSKTFPSNWKPVGSFRYSDIETTGYNSSKSLRLVGTSEGNNGPNNVFATTTSSYANGQSGQLQAKVRWVGGTRNFMMRLNGGFLDAYAQLDIPVDLGTPGLENSRHEANAAPAIEEVAHSPMLPSNSQAATISAFVSDNDGVSSVKLFWRKDATSPGNYNTVTMSKSNGMYTGNIPAQSGSLVQYYIEATDTSGAKRYYPENYSANRQALVRFGSPSLPGDFGSMRIWITKANIAQLTAFPDSLSHLSNAEVNSTLVYGDNRLIHNAGFRYRGSIFIRPSLVGNSPDDPNQIGSYKIKLPEGEELLNARSFNLDSLEQVDPNYTSKKRDATFQRERLAYWYAEQLGLPTIYPRYTYVYVNGVRKGEIYVDVQKPNKNYLQSRFPKDDDGDMHSIDDWVVFDTDGEKVIATREKGFLLEGVEDGGTWTDVTIRNPDGSLDQSYYRMLFEKKQGGTEDFTEFLKLVDAIDKSNWAELEESVDMDAFFGIIALRILVGDGDGFGGSNGKNALLYKPEKSGWHPLLWDLDFAMTAQNNAESRPVNERFVEGLNNWRSADNRDPAIFRMSQNGAFKRSFFKAMERMQPLLQESFFMAEANKMYNAFQANGVSAISPTVNSADDRATMSIKDFLNGRRTQLETEFGWYNIDSATFSVNQPVITGTGVAILEGTAPADVDTIRVNGFVIPLTWTGEFSWQMYIALPAGDSDFLIEGYKDGEPMGASFQQWVRDLNPNDGIGSGSSLIAHWKFDETTTTAADSSGNGYNGTYKNGVGHDNDVPAALGSGNSARFDGNNDYIEIAQEAAFNLEENFSISFWTKVTAWDEGYMGFVTKGDGNNWRITRNGTEDKLNFTYNDPAYGYPSAISSDMSTAEWHHVVCVHENNTGYIYVNGVKSSGTSGKAGISTDPLLIGATWINGATRYLNGKIDDLRIYNEPLGAFNVENLLAGREHDDAGSSLVGVLPGNIAGKLVISEIMHSPTADSSAPQFSDSDYEYIELHNKSSNAISLGGAEFDAGISYNFDDGDYLLAGEYALLVKDLEAFESRYSTSPHFGSMRILGEFDGKLSSSENVRIIDHNAAIIIEVNYNDVAPWPTTASGTGASISQASTSTDGTQGSHWVADQVDGTPGRAYAASGVAQIIISEILAHTDAPQSDSIELYNPTDSAVNVGGWFLSDDTSNKKLFKIPSLSIPSKGYVKIKEDDDGNPSSYPSVSSGYFGSVFQLSSHGDEITLYSADSSGNLTGYTATQSFGASKNGHSFGRYMTSDSLVYYPWQSSVSLGASNSSLTAGAANSGPKIGPLVISEILAAPAVGSYEFIEIKNISSSTVNLYDDTNVPGKSNPDNTYQVTGVDFTFPTGISMQANEVIILTDAASAADFRAQYPNTPAGVQIFSYNGGVSASGEKLRIKFPDTEDTLNTITTVPYIVMDEVDFGSSQSWPVATLGQSIMRNTPDSYGNEPTHWSISSTPTPGEGGAPPPPTMDVTYIAEGDSWKYFEGYTLPGSTWMNKVFSDGSWLTGASGFGYKYTHGTVLDMEDKYSTLFLRKTFTVASASAVTELTLTVDCDDGYVAYLNGTEIRRLNAPSGTISNTDEAPVYRHSTFAGGSLDIVTVPTNLLVDGDNVLAIVTLNAGISSSDLVMVPVLTAKVSTGSSIDFKHAFGVTTDAEVSQLLAGAIYKDGSAMKFTMPNKSDDYTYNLEYKTDLLTGTWVELLTSDIAGSDTSTGVAVTLPSEDHLYIRVKVSTITP